jgi:Ca2+-transporting ATPase
MKGALERVLGQSGYSADGAHLTKPPEGGGKAGPGYRPRGLRILAFAYKHVPSSVTEITHADVERDLVFLGIQGMIDPPRQEALLAIRGCHNAGHSGEDDYRDHVLTASAIAKRLELSTVNCDDANEPPALNGTELSVISDEDLVRAAADTVVFRSRYVRNRSSEGTGIHTKPRHVVAMTGDGDERRSRPSSSRHRRGHGHNWYRGGQGSSPIWWLTDV